MQQAQQNVNHHSSQAQRAQTAAVQANSTHLQAQAYQQAVTAAVNAAQLNLNSLGPGPARDAAQIVYDNVYLNLNNCESIFVRRVLIDFFNTLYVYI